MNGCYHTPGRVAKLKDRVDRVVSTLMRPRGILPQERTRKNMCTARLAHRKALKHQRVPGVLSAPPVLIRFA